MRYFAFPIVLVLTLISLAHAHAVIVRSSLDTHPPEPDQAAKVSLIFNSHIETRLSQVLLVTQGDRKRPLPFQAGKERGEVVVDLPPLPPGEYALQLKVFAADGHLTEEVRKFFIRGEK
ncbi:MAG: copper resistance protein CopC [Methylohalobius sp.]|nr:copper resistance protein CopC [Methylohalobius sp.]